MRFFNICSLALLTATASAGLFRGEQQKALEDPPKVPGDNPLTFCSKPADDILKINKVDLSPNPPKAYVFLSPVSRSTALPSDSAQILIPRSSQWTDLVDHR